MKMLWFCLLFAVGLASSQNATKTNPVGNIIGNPCTDKNHLFLAPGVLTAGNNNRACVSRFFTDGPARLVLTLLTEDRQTVTASSQLSGDGGCLDINVPSLPNTKADLIVNIRYPEAQCVWERRLPLRISSGRLLVITTERARYRPGELLRLRVLALKQDLAPSHALIEEVWLEGPPGAWEGSRLTQWQRVRTRLGLAQLQYQLDELAPSGKWTVRAKLADGSQGSSAFWVGNYELPPFQLSVRHAPRVLRTSERLVWHVCVRYPWSEAVEGMLVIRLRGAGGVAGGAGVRTAVRLRAPRACHRHAAAAHRVGLDAADPPDVVVADFSFQEEGTKIWQNTTVVSQVVDKPISLEFLTKYRAVISPGLPYKLKVKATRWDDKPAADELVHVCRYPSTQAATLARAAPRDNMCAEGATDAAGIATLLFAAGDDAAPFYRFEAHLSNDTSISAVPLSLPVPRPSTVFAALGPLKPDPGQTRTFVPLYLNTNDTSKPYTVHFVVITRGGVILRWAVTTQCLTASAAHAHTAPRHTTCNIHDIQRDVIMTQHDSKTPPQPNRSFRRIPFFEELKTKTPESTGSHDILMAQRDTSSFNLTDASDALLDRHQLRVLLPIRMSHQMCPDSHLIAYFYHDGELISASKQFDKDDCFSNKVEATWLTRQAQPGSTVTLQVTTPGPALCGLTVLDTAAKWTQAPQPPKEQLMSSLRRLIDSHRNLTEYDLAGECFLNSDSQDVPSTSIELTASWMAAAGVRVLGGDVQPGTRNCVSRPPALLVAEENTVPRSDFSEAWLWRLLSVSANGSGAAQAQAPHSITRYDASAICVSRTGIAISAPAVLQVFREFFIHADSPKRLRRGDSTIIRYRIFNYLYEPLSVQIQILTDPHLEGPRDLVETACVGARASIARRVEVRAREVGPAKVSIRAKAVSDGNCGNVTSGKTGVSDEVIIRIAVNPEGAPVQEQKSILLCGNSSTESSKSEVLWKWPAVKAVPGTETLTVWAVGDVTGPLLADADSLLSIPRGCGEQNMAQLATNLLALNQLEPSSIAALTAKEHVARGFTRQLQYVHPSGGFSAFGASDATSSTWLTAFVVKHMRRAHKVLWPNLQVPPAIIRAERWLLNQQMENGCFRNEGQVFHRELRGGLNDEGEIASVALTAYVITSLIESSSPLPYRVIHNTLSCLRAFPPLKSKTPTRVYAQALLAYAYMKLQDYEEQLRSTNEASLRRSVGGLEENEGVKQVLELMKIARRSGEYVWWEANSLSSSIEATSYALMTLRSTARALPPHARAQAPAAARWLQAHRAPGGGFISTQDTLVALEALSAWSWQATNTNLTLSARTSGKEHRMSLRPGVKVPDVVRVTPGELLTVAVAGTGCALVQATRTYNVLSTDSAPHDKQLSVQVSVHTDGPFDCDNGTNCFCAAVIEACVMWTGSFPEMALMEVTLPGGFGADAQLLYSQLHKSTTLLRRIELTPPSSRVTFYLGSRDGSHTSAGAAHHCYTIHTTGPKVKTRPAYVKVQDYYAPNINDTKMYTIPEECPPRIALETNDYLTSDNLFPKARAAGTDEIVITHEFSFDDIPEGLPLDDPLMFDHILTENDNYRAASQRHQEIGNLRSAKHTTYFAGNVHNVSNIVLQQHIPKSAEENHRRFHNVGAGYNDPERLSISKSKEKDIDHTNIEATYFGIPKITDAELGHSGDVVTKKDQFTESLSPEHDFERTAPKNIRINDSIGKEQSNFEFNEDGSGINAEAHNSNFNDKNDGYFGIVDELHAGIRYFNDPGTGINKINEDTHKVQSNLAINVRENINSDIIKFAGNHVNLSTTNNIKIDDKLRINGSSVQDYSKFHNTGISNTKSNVKPKNNNNHYFCNLATENAVTIADSDMNPYNIESYQKSELEIEDVKTKKDESKHDIRNNLFKEIDSLNKVANQQLDETKTKFVAHQSDYKFFDTFFEDDKIMTINTNNRKSDEINHNFNSKEGSKSREKEIKRSYNENVTSVPELPENIVKNYGTDLENNKGVDNPNLADFHVIDTEKDLDVPTGIEGPIPSAVLPPPGYVPPAQIPDAGRFGNNPRSGDIRAIYGEAVPPPPKFILPPKRNNQFRMKTLPAEADLSLTDERPVMFDGLPPSDFPAPPFHGYQDPHQANIQRAFGTILPPISYESVPDLRTLHSIDTPNGRYFYFQADNGYNANRKFFIPVR